MKKILTVIFTVLGLLLGTSLTYTLFRTHVFTVGNPGLILSLYILGGLLGAFLAFLLSGPVGRVLFSITERVELALNEVSGVSLGLGVLGLVTGLVIAFLVSRLLLSIELPYIGNVLSVILSFLLYIGLPFVGVRLAIRGRDEVNGSLFKIRSSGRDRKSESNTSTVKVLDTSVIIDGRILDVIRSGFIEGTILVPVFVLEELQHIADSQDRLRRQKGRRGLDILQAIREEKKVLVELPTEKYPEEKEVDSKLLCLARDHQAKILTTDFNLNKVATVHNIEVLNINELANAVKPVVIPGESMVVEVVKDGKEANQGLAYLEDGTMIVVEDGRPYIGQKIEVMVSTVFQTAAGKMIFVKPK